MTYTCLVVHDPVVQNYSDRLINGLKAAGCKVQVITSVSPYSIFHSTYDYIFVEHGVNFDCSILRLYYTKDIFLYNVEDQPTWHFPKEGYESLKGTVSHYVRYNYCPSKPNPDGLINIGAMQHNYITMGAAVAQNIYPQRNKVDRLGDAYFMGGPSYMTDYTPDIKVRHIDEPGNIQTVVRRHPGTGLPTETDWLYYQRLEWIDVLSRSPDIKFNGGLWFPENLPDDSCISLEHQKKLFGPGIEKYAVKFKQSLNYYSEWLGHPIALCPSGIARSSYRIIEIMALGKIIMLTDWKDYTYLYNPKQYITVPDGLHIEEKVQYTLDNEAALLEAAKENVAVFANLTPGQMFEDFIAQTK